MPTLEREAPTIEHSFQRQGKIVQYDVAFDTNEYGEFATLKTKDPLVYEEKKKSLDGFVKFNLETAIGERFNAGLSKRRDEIINGEICDTNMKRPMLAMIKNGVEYRAKNGSSPSDQLREKAEVIGFEKIQDVLASPLAPVGTMMVSISPPGEGDSIYKHNFYDVFTLKQDEDGIRYIEPRRYSSGLDREEYIHKAIRLEAAYFEDEEAKDLPFDAYFLSHPLRIDPDHTLSDADVIHREFHKNHEYMDNAEYREIIRLCQPFIHAYLDQLAKNPYDTYGRNVRFNAILNKADEIADQRKNGIIEHDVFVTDAEIYRLGEQEVRKVGTGCGSSGGAETGSVMDSILSPFSVSEFGGESDQYGSLQFECPNEMCKKTNVRERNKLLTHCQHCGVDVRC